MSLSFKEVRCKVAEWCENPPWADQPDLDEQTLQVDCEAGTLAISNGNDVPLSQLGASVVYRLAPNTTPGVNNREWHDTAPVVPISQSTTAAGRAFRLSHDFSLPTTTVSTLTSINMNDTDNTGGELDVQVLDTVITVPAGGVWIQYQGGSEGYWAIEVGQCCGPLELAAELGYSDRLNNLAIVGPVFLPEGQHQWRAWNIDSGGTSSAHAARYSLDGTTFGTAVPAGVEFSLSKRPVECMQVNSCDVDGLDEGWSTCPPPDCLGEPVDPLPQVPGEPDTDTRLTVTPEVCEAAWGSTRRSYHRRWGFGGQVFPDTTDFANHVLGPVVDGTWTAPCDGVAEVEFAMPWVRTMVRDSFYQGYISYSVLKNGALVGNTNYVNDVLFEHVENDQDRSEIGYDDHQAGANWHVPVVAGDTLAVEWQIQSRRIGAYPGSPYTRMLVYRRHFSVQLITDTVMGIVTDVEVVV